MELLDAMPFHIPSLLDKMMVEGTWSGRWRTFRREMAPEVALTAFTGGLKTWNSARQMGRLPNSMMGQVRLGNSLLQEGRSIQQFADFTEFHGVADLYNRYLNKSQDVNLKAAGVSFVAAEAVGFVSSFASSFSAAYRAAANAGPSVVNAAAEGGDIARILASKAPGAGMWANSLNSVQSVVPKLASVATSIAAALAPAIAADAFGRILPKNTPPVLRAAATTLVGTAVAAAVSGPVGAVVFAVTSIISIFAIPKPLIVLLSLIVSAAAFQYYRHRRWLQLQRLRSVRGTMPLRI